MSCKALLPRLKAALCRACSSVASHPGPSITVTPTHHLRSASMLPARLAVQSFSGNTLIRGLAPGSSLEGLLEEPGQSFLLVAERKVCVSQQEQEQEQREGGRTLTVLRWFNLQQLRQQLQFRQEGSDQLRLSTGDCCARADRCAIPKSQGRDSIARQSGRGNAAANRAWHFPGMLWGAVWLPGREGSVGRIHCCPG